MKNTLLILLSAILLLSSPACRKGEDDPLLSFISRENRLEGNWTLQSGEMSAELISDNAQIPAAEYVMTADSMTVNMGDYAYTFPYSEQLSFNKNGTFSLTASQDMGGGYISESELTGDWEFMDKSGDYKNKERVKLMPLYTISYDTIDVSDSYTDYILILTRLANDELEFDYEYRLQEHPEEFIISGSKKFIQ